MDEALAGDLERVSSANFEERVHYGLVNYDGVSHGGCGVGE